LVIPPGLITEHRLPRSENRTGQAGDGFPRPSYIEEVAVRNDPLSRADVDPVPLAWLAREAPEVVSLQVMMALAELHEVGELRLTPLGDGDDVVAFQPVGDATSRHCTHPVSLAEGGLEVSGNPAAEMRHGGDLDALLDDQLGPRVAEEVLDRREGDGSHAFDLAALPSLQLPAAERLDAHM
jgi:hypothetical protein